ncbi:MAG: hypothetical protein DCE90_03895 [Pseudanabaena sp.]|nr:MAG: hypothetical protein DCE90_03895 [Pseudanabaena sp.]
MQKINLSSFMLCGVTVAIALSGAKSVNAQSMDVLFGQAYNVWQSWRGDAQRVQEIRSRPSRLPGEGYVDREAQKLEASLASATSIVKKQAEMLNDPAYILYLTGHWRLFPTPQGQKSGEFCSAFFSRNGVMLTLSGPGGDYRGALLTFMSADIPKPEKMEVVKVTLTQDDEPSVTTQAFNYSPPNMPFGAIAFAVPTVEAALSNMKDVQVFKVEMAGKSVAKINWHSGLAAGGEMRKCLNGQPYSITTIDIMPKNMKR